MEDLPGANMPKIALLKQQLILDHVIWLFVLMNEHVCTGGGGCVYVWSCYQLKQKDEELPVITLEWVILTSMSKGQEKVAQASGK